MATDIEGRIAADAEEKAGELATGKFNSDSSKDATLQAAAQQWISANPTANDAAVKNQIAASETGAQASDIKLVSGGATFQSVSGGTAIATGATTSNAAINGSATTSDYQFDKTANLKLTDVSASNSSAVVVAKSGDDSFTLQANGTGSSTITFTFDYQPTITSYKYSYDGTCTVKYTGINYTGWKYTQTYKYTVGDDTTVKTKNVEADGGEVNYSTEKSIDNVAYTITKAEAKPATALSTGQDATSQTYSDLSVTVKNLFPESLDGSSDLDNQEKPLGFGDTATVSDLFPSASFATDGAKAHAISLLGEPSYNSDYFTIAQSGTSLNVTAKRQTNGEQASVDVNWSYGSSTNSITAKHTIKATIGPGVINLGDFRFSTDASTFRLQDDIKQHALDDLNAYILEKANAANQKAGLGSNSISDVYYSSVSLTDFDATNMGEQTAIIEPVKSSTTAYGNFNVQGELADLKISAVKDVTWPEGFKLSTKDVTLSNSDNAGSTWIKERPTASYDGHALAYAVTEAPSEEGGYDDSVTLSGGDGDHSNVSLFALNKQTHEITRITGVSYKLDTQAPALLSAEYSTPNGGSTIETGTTLFGKDTVKVDLGIVDEVSGLKEQPKVTYHDDEAGADRTPSLTDNDPFYSFSLGANEDVRTNSIEVYAIDKAGNELNAKATDSKNIPAGILRLVADADAPQMSVTWDNYDVRNGSYYNANRTMTITITEQFFNYIQQYQGDQEIAAISGSNGTAVVVHPSDFSETSSGSNVWTYRYTFSSDADWTASNIRVTDLVGHAASAASESFTIDATSPAMDVAFDNNNASNGNYYNAPRTATITVTEHNFDGSLVDIEPTANAGNGDSVGSPSVSGWSNNGDVHTATVNFPGEGVYTLTVTGVDLATNSLSTYTASEFVIDTTTPQIQISGVDNRQAYPGSAQPNVTVQDTNISDATTIDLGKISYPMSNDDANPYSESRANATTEITVSYPDADRIVENDGVYTLTVHAVDMAGNTADEAVTWSVNRFGSTYVLSDDTTKMLNSYLQDSKVSNVVVTEINPSGLNDAATAVELTHDTSNSTLKRGSDYGVSQSDDTGWSEYTYNVQKSNFGSDGSYRVLFHSEDLASNTSENTMKNKNRSRTAAAEVTFAVDNTAPIVSFIDLDSNGLYDESTHTAQVNIEDNMKLDAAEVTIDGQKALELDSAALASSSTHSFDVPESTSTHEIVVTAYDAAGNAETIAATNVTVTTDPVKLWMNNTPLFVSTIVGGIVVIALAAAFVSIRVRRPGQ